VDYWQVAKEGNDDRPPEEHSTKVREGVDMNALDRIDKKRDTITERKMHEDDQGE